MNIKLIATLAALAIAAPTMGCSHDTEAPEQQDGVKKSDVQVDPNDKKTDDQKTDQDQKPLDQQGVCQAGSGVEGNPCDPGGGGY